MQDKERVRIKDHDIFNALGEIEPGPHLQILGLVASANHLDHRFGNESSRLFFLIGFLAKDGNIRPLQRAVWKGDINVGRVHAGTAVCIAPHRGLNGSPDAFNRFLVLPHRVRLPEGKPGYDLKPYSKLFGTEKLRFHGQPF